MIRPILKQKYLLDGFIFCSKGGQSIEGFSWESYYASVDNELGGLTYDLLALGGILVHFQYKWHLINQYLNHKDHTLDAQRIAKTQ